MKKLLTIVIILSILCCSGCVDTDKKDNDRFLTKDEYGETFGQSWFDAIEGATEYPGNVHAYYEDGEIFPVKYNIYFEKEDYWIELDGKNDLDESKQLMEIPAYIYLKKVDDEYTVTALICEFDRMIEVE